MHEATKSSHRYDFRKDFDLITRPGLVRYLKHLGYGVDEGEDVNEGDLDPTYYNEAKTYALRAFRALRVAQKFSDITAWTLESAIALANAVGTTKFLFDQSISWTENSRPPALATRKCHASRPYIAGSGPFRLARATINR